MIEIYGIDYVCPACGDDLFLSHYKRGGESIGTPAYICFSQRCIHRDHEWPYYYYDPVTGEEIKNDRNR